LTDNPNRNFADREFNEEVPDDAGRISDKDDQLFNRPYEATPAEEVAREATKATQSGDKDPGFNSEKE
jgi:hypothetical protein